MKKIEGKLGINEDKMKLIPGVFFDSSAIPTSYGTFSTGYSNFRTRPVLYVGSKIEFSTYQQA